jgi:hypothetical protein
MSQVEALAVIVIVDKEAHRSPKGLQRSTKTATASRQAFEIGPQVRIEALNRVGFFFAQRDEMLTPFGPDQFCIDGMSIAGVARCGRQCVYHCLQGGKLTILAHVLANDQPGVARDGNDDVDAVFFSRT